MLVDNVQYGFLVLARALFSFAPMLMSNMKVTRSRSAAFHCCGKYPSRSTQRKVYVGSQFSHVLVRFLGFVFLGLSWGEDVDKARGTCNRALLLTS